MSGTILLSNAETAPALVPGRPFVSVVSRIDVRATNDAGEVVGTSSVTLRRYDSTAVVMLEVPEGSITFNVDVVSSRNIVVYSGQTTAIVSDGFSVEVPLDTLRPVLVIQDDTVRTTGVPAQFRVYNAGASILSWSVDQLSCAIQCRVDPRSSQLPAKRDTSFVASVVNPALASTVFPITVNSAEGSVTVVWVYTRPTVTSVNVIPDTATIFIGNTRQFTAVVQANAPTAVTWSSSNPGVATVTTSGLVRGVAGGVTYIRAVSQVDATKLDSSRVTVPNPIGFQSRSSRAPR